MKNTLRSTNLPLLATADKTWGNPKKNATKSLKGLLALVLMVMVMGVSLGQVSITNTTPITQNFNGLSSTSGVTWTNNTTPLAGWYSTVTSFAVNTGSTNSNGVYNCGTASATDRALGALSTATTHNFGIRLKNNNVSTITSLQVAFTGEEWRQAATAQTLVFEYQIASTVTSITSGTWVPVTALDFLAPITGAAGAIDGNATANRTAKSAIISLTIVAGSEIMLRWTKAGSSSPLLAIDDLSITPVFGATPTITATGSLSSVNTTYGTASTTPTSFSVSGANMSAGITVTPPAGFEVSTTSDFSSTIGTNASALTVGASGAISSTTVYVRLAATAAVASSPFSGNIVLSSTSATSVNVATVSSSVTAKAITITGLTGANKNYDGTTSASFTGTAAYNGLANGQTFSVTGTPVAVFSDAVVGTGKTITISGYTAPSTNYSLTQPTLSGAIIAVVPDAPTIGASTAGNGQANVAFSAPSFTGGASITGYIVTSSPDGITASGATSPITVIGLTNGTAYTFSVVATNSVGNSGSSSASNSVTPSSGPTVPDAPIIGTATSGNTEVSVAFTAPTSDGGSAITGYTVTSSPGGFSGTGASSPIVVTGLTNGTPYTFTVVATNSVGNSVSSSASTIVTPATTPSAPTILEITAANTQLSVAFTVGATGGSALTNYKYSIDNGATFTACSPSQTTSPIVITSLTNGTSYSVQIKAVNTVGDGTASASATGTPATTTSAPTITGITPGNAQLSVAFSVPSSEGGSAITNYKYSTDNGATFTACSPLQTSSPIVITGLTNGTVYNIQIRAVNAIGDGTASASTSGTPVTTPSAPTISAITAGDTQLSVAFTAGANGGSVLTNYKYSTDNGATFIACSPLQTSSPIVITGLTNGTTYQVQIKAVNSLGDGVASASLSGTPAPTPVVLAGWDFSTQTGGTGNYGTSPLTVNTSDANVAVGSLTRGSGFGTLTGSGVAAAWGATNFTLTGTAPAGTLDGEITANKFYTFTITANTGKLVTLTEISTYTVRRSTSGTPSGQWQYQIGNGSFINIGSAVSFSSTAAAGTVMPAIDLSGITGLSQISSSSTITLRLVSYGATGTSGTNYIKDLGNSTANDLIVKGFITAPATPPSLTADTTANTVDNNIDITFTDDATWRSKITAVKIGTTALTVTTDYVISAGNIQLKPSGLNALLTASGSKAVTVVATGYSDATVTQTIGAGVPTDNSTASISAILAPNAIRTITCTAKDQFNNLVSGYYFKYDAAIVSSDATTTESYSIDSAAITATANDTNLSSVTNASGIVTFTVVMPTTLDANDGISLQVQLSDGTTNVGTAFAYHELPGQTITFGALAAVTYGDAAFTVSATGGASGNPVTFTSSDPLVATCSGTNGTTITILKTGTTTIRANQAGNSSYNAAAQVDQLLTINTKGLTVTGLTGVNKVYNGSTTATFTGTPTYDGLVYGQTFTVTGTPTASFANANVETGKTITIAGYTAPSTNYTVTQPTLTADITQASQTISFGSLPNRVLGGATFTLTQNTTPTPSGPALAINYVSSDTNVATISGNTVTIVGVGTTTITATQPGDSNYSAATTVTQSQTILPVPIAGWDFTGAGNYTTLAATTFSSNLVSTSNANTITRGSTASSSTGANSFRTTGFENNGINIVNTDYFQITLAPAAGNQVSLSTINANFVGTAGFYATSGVTSQYAYSMDGSTFTLIGSPITSTSLKPAEIDLTGTAALQNVPPGTIITIRYYASGQTTTGGWGFNSPSAGVNGLAIGGSFTPVNTWTGTSNNSFNNSNNWSFGVAPLATDAILIDSGNPVLDTDFTIGSSGSLTISGSGSLTINSTKTLTITGTANFGGKSVTIKSDSNGTGAIGQVTGTLTGATNVTVERYIPNKRAWRALTAPLKGSNASIFSQWQNNGTVTAGIGVDLWGPAGDSTPTSTNTGLAIGPSNSMLQYVAGAWTAVTNTNTTNLFTTSGNNAFMVFPTGGYGSGLISGSATPVPTTLKATGQLITGPVNYTALPSASHTLIGNPYASPLDIATMLGANSTFSGYVWVWDANLVGSYSVGAYNLFDRAVGASGNYSNLTDNAGISGAQIQSGQAFFVKPANDLSTFTIQETHKGSAFSNAVFRNATSAEVLRVGLYKQTNNQWSGRDGAMAVFLSDAEANPIANKMANGSENVAFTKNGILFASEHHLPLVASDVLNVRVWNTTAGANYKLKINTEQFTTTNLNATLEDVFTNSRTPIALDGRAIEYPFAVTTEAASTGNRFRIVFETNALGINNPKASGITILPNPITGDTFQVNLGTLGIGTYAYTISNALGQEVEKGSINNVTQNTSYTVKFKNATAAGMYIMKVTGSDNSVFTAKLIKK